jgi:hypothetical protein
MVTTVEAIHFTSNDVRQEWVRFLVRKASTSSLGQLGEGFISRRKDSVGSLPFKVATKLQHRGSS